MHNRKYFDYTIERSGLNSSGVRWIAHTGSGKLRSDTLVGIKKLIREHKRK